MAATLTRDQARRLAVAGTLLDGSLADSGRILDVVRKIGSLQLGAEFPGATRVAWPRSNRRPPEHK
jgi:hypothetical protein